jgi:hypothetical protein
MPVYNGLVVMRFTSSSQTCFILTTDKEDHCGEWWWSADPKTAIDDHKRKGGHRHLPKLVIITRFAQDTPLTLFPDLFLSDISMNT